MKNILKETRLRIKLCNRKTKAKIRELQKSVNLLLKVNKVKKSISLEDYIKRINSPET